MKIPAFGNPNKYRKRMEERNEKHRKVHQLAEDVVILSCQSTAKGGVCDVYVVGTTHYTRESCREVQAVMSYLKPEVVFLEVCKGRSSLLRPVVPENFYSVTHLAKDVMDKCATIYDAIEKWNFIKYLKKFKFETSEFCVAYEEAKKYGSKVVLGDRPAEVTSKRLWRKLSLWQKIYTSYFGYFGLCINPIHREVTFDERDKYMAHQLFEVARKNSSVVVVVGRAHLKGIKKYWKQPIQVEDLMTVPPPSNSYLQCLGVAVVGVASISLVIIFLI